MNTSNLRYYLPRPFWTLIFITLLAAVFYFFYISQTSKKWTPLNGTVLSKILYDKRAGSFYLCKIELDDKTVIDSYCNENSKINEKAIIYKVESGANTIYRVSDLD